MATKKGAVNSSPPKPIQEALNKTALVARIVDASGITAKDVRAVLDALDDIVIGSIHKDGVGSFTLPGLIMIKAIQVPAKPKRKGINRFTKQEEWFAAKPASVKVKVRPLKRLRNAAV